MVMIMIMVKMFIITMIMIIIAITIIISISYLVLVIRPSADQQPMELSAVENHNCSLHEFASKYVYYDL